MALQESAESQELIERYAGVGNTSVVRNDAYKKLVSAKKISRREAAAMDSLAYDFGANIEFVDNLTDEYGKPINGEYSEDGRTIRISTQSTDPFFATVLHESVHALRRGDSLSFYRLNAELKNLVGTNTSEFSKAYSTVKRSYARRMNGNKAIDKNLVDEEFTSFMLSYLMDNPETLKKIAHKNMNSVQRIVDTVLGWFDKSISRYENMDTRYQGNFADAVAKLRDKRDAFAHFFGRASEGYYRDSLDAFGDSFAKHSIAYTDKKQPVVIFDNDFLEGKKKKEWAKATYGYIKKYSPAIPVHGQLIKVTVDSRNEYVGSDYSRHLKFTDDVKYKDKLLFAGNLDEILWASVDYVNEKPKHDRSDDIVDFARGKVLLKIGKRKYTADVVVALTSNGNARFHDLVDLNPTDFIIKEAGKNNPLVGSSLRKGLPTSNNSIPHNQPFDNTNIDENASADLGDVHSADASSYSNAQARYGLEGIEEYGGVSFARADVDERLGREFQFEDNTVTSRVRDKLGNSLHLSDNVVFEYGERANVEYGTGRIVSIGEDGSVEIAVDSGNFRDSVVIPARQITFVSHNDESTISKDFKTSNYLYDKARSAYENFVRSQNGQMKISLGMKDSQRYEILRNKTINAPQCREFNLNGKQTITKADLEALESSYKKVAVPVIKKVAQEFGATRLYENKDIELEFEFSNSSPRESINKQKKRYVDFAKMLTVFPEIVENAVGIEVHDDRYKGTARENTDLKQTYVLISAFRDGEYIVPVRFTVKEFIKQRPHVLYAAICDKKWKMRTITQPSDFINTESQRPTSPETNIPQMTDDVNGEIALGWFDKSISRYENMDTRYQGNFTDAVAKLRDKRDAFAHFFAVQVMGIIGMVVKTLLFLLYPIWKDLQLKSKFLCI